MDVNLMRVYAFSLNSAPISSRLSTGLCNRLERLGLIGLGAFDAIHFQKLEDQIHGVPFYRRSRR